MSAFKEGVKAFTENVMPDQSPYRQFTDEWSKWLDGYLAAGAGDDCENGRGEDED